MAKTTVVNAAAKTVLTTIFPVSTDATVAAGFTAAQITYISAKIAKELQEQKAGPIIKDLFTRIMAV